MNQQVDFTVFNKKLRSIIKKAKKTKRKFVKKNQAIVYKMSSPPKQSIMSKEGVKRSIVFDASGESVITEYSDFVLTKSLILEAENLAAFKRPDMLCDHLRVNEEDAYDEAMEIIEEHQV
jgi:hypothetical protein